MNLTDLDRTSVAEALDAVRSSAEERGARVEETELVGLLPINAVLDAARRHLDLPGLRTGQVIEAALWESWGAGDLSRCSTGEQPLLRRPGYEEARWVVWRV